LVRPPASGSLGSGKRLAERHRRYIPVPPASAPSSMTALLTLCPHLSEQQGATPHLQHRGQLTGLCLFEGKIGRGIISPSATLWRDQIVAPMQQVSSPWLHR
ncbi:MAG: hypothetical protein ACRDC6_28055, partial [Shewanella sp.]